MVRDKAQRQLANKLMYVTPGIFLIQLNRLDNCQGVARFKEQVLSRIEPTDTQVVILYMTRISRLALDAAKHITEIICSVQLFGAKVVLVGVNSRISKQLEYLGADISDTRIFPTLATGLWFSMDMSEQAALRPVKSKLKV